VTFATVRHRSKVTKGPGSRTAGIAMAFKMIEVAQVGWRAVNAPHLVALLGAGAKFENKIVERSGDQPATTAALTEPLTASIEDSTLAGPDGSGMVEGSEADEVEQLGEDRGEQQGAAEDVTAPESEEGVTAEIATVEPKPRKPSRLTTTSPRRTPPTRHRTRQERSRRE
jgi:hypothetical protein